MLHARDRPEPSASIVRRKATTFTIAQHGATQHVPHHHQLVGIVAEPHVPHSIQAAHEESGANQQQDRQRALRDEQRGPGARPVVGTFARPRLERAGEVGLRREQRGDDAGQQRREQRRRQRHQERARSPRAAKTTAQSGQEQAPQHQAAQLRDDDA